MLNFPFFYNSNYYLNNFNKPFYPNCSNHVNKSNMFSNINQSNFKNTYFGVKNNEYKKNDANCYTYDNSQIKNNSKNNYEQNYFLELFGIKLYLDDILIISIIFFLYQEGIRDDELFICLILLLLA